MPTECMAGTLGQVWVWLQVPEVAVGMDTSLLLTGVMAGTVVLAAGAQACVSNYCCMYRS